LLFHLLSGFKALPLDNYVILEAKKVNRGKIDHKDFRGSLYRGVSVNGRKFQVFAMIHKEKIYLCSTKKIEKAALLYDILLI
jgi:hypothetical protein